MPLPGLVRLLHKRLVTDAKATVNSHDGDVHSPHDRAGLREDRWYHRPTAPATIRVYFDVGKLPWTLLLSRLFFVAGRLWAAVGIVELFRNV